MAMPTSARVSTGASLMPSPTKASLPFPAPCAWVSSSSFSTSVDLVLRAAAARGTRRCPAPSPRRAATSARSPVSMTVFFTPAARKAATASAASGLTTSAMTMWPMYSPSSDTCRMVPVSSQSRQSTPHALMSLSLPTYTTCSVDPRAHAVAALLLHVVDALLVDGPRSRPRAPTARWDGSEYASACAAMDSSSVGVDAGGGVHGRHVERAVGERAGLVEHDGLGLAQASPGSCCPSRGCRAREAPPMPPKNDSGTLMTSAQGHDTTRKISAALHPVGPAAAQQKGGMTAKQRRDADDRRACSSARSG